MQIVFTIYQNTHLFYKDGCYEKLFNEVPNNLHNSLNDVLVCFRCYYKMRYNLDILQEDDKFGGFDCF